MALNGFALGAIAAGSVFAYAGIKGISVTKALQSIVQGKSPASVQQTNPIVGSANSPVGPASGGGPGAGPPVAGSGQSTPRQVYLALRHAGFGVSAGIMMTAIAGVESTWNTRALNDTPATGDLSVGITQINYYDGLDAERTALLGMGWQQLLDADLQTQANATYTLYKSAGGFGPWQPDITSGKIYAYWSQALAAAQGGG